jgi:hypothetical protein
MSETYLGKQAFAQSYMHLVPQVLEGSMSGTLSACVFVSGEQNFQNAETYYVHPLYIS